MGTFATPLHLESMSRRNFWHNGTLAEVFININVYTCAERTDWSSERMLAKGELRRIPYTSVQFRWSRGGLSSQGTKCHCHRLSADYRFFVLRRIPLVRGWGFSFIMPICTESFSRIIPPGSDWHHNNQIAQYTAPDPVLRNGFFMQKIPGTGTGLE